MPGPLASRLKRGAKRKLRSHPMLFVGARPRRTAANEGSSTWAVNLYRRDILISMTRRQALVLSLGGSVAAQVSNPARAPQSKTRSQRSPTAPPQDSLVRWSPRPVFNGAPVLFESKSFSGLATWLGKKIEFRPDGDAFSALAGVNLNRAPGRYPLALGDETVDITVIRRVYASSTISVPQKFVEPPKELQAQIDEEVAISKTFSSLLDRADSGTAHLSRRPMPLIPLHLACGAFTMAGHAAYIKGLTIQLRWARKLLPPTPVTSRSPATCTSKVASL